MPRRRGRNMWNLNFKKIKQMLHLQSPKD
jgi:hypothetical protein